jgi:hypothetical protein
MFIKDYNYSDWSILYHENNKDAKQIALLVLLKEDCTFEVLYKGYYKKVRGGIEIDYNADKEYSPLCLFLTIGVREDEIYDLRIKTFQDMVDNWENTQWDPPVVL